MNKNFLLILRLQAGIMTDNFPKVTPPKVFLLHFVILENPYLPFYWSGHLTHKYVSYQEALMCSSFSEPLNKSGMTMQARNLLSFILCLFSSCSVTLRCCLNRVQYSIKVSLSWRILLNFLRKKSTCIECFLRNSHLRNFQLQPFPKTLLQDFPPETCDKPSL